MTQVLNLLFTDRAVSSTNAALSVGYNRGAGVSPSTGRPTRELEGKVAP